MFRYETKIRLYDTDAAGILFFAAQFRLVQEAFEEFLEKYHMPLNKILTKKDYLLPFVHAESDFLQPLYAGDNIEITLKCIRTGTTSFTIGHQILKNGTPAGSGNTVHVTMDRKTKEKIELPAEIKKLISNL